MTLWDAYRLLLHRLGLGPHPFPDDTEAGGELAALPHIQWLPSAEAMQFNPWLWLGMPLACAFALIGQLSLSPNRPPWLGLAALVSGAGVMIFESWRLKLDWRISRDAAAIAQPETLPLPGLAAQPVAQSVRWRFVVGAYIATALTFVLSANNDFNPIACATWIASLAFWVIAFWDGPWLPSSESVRSLLARLSKPKIDLHPSRTLLLLLLVLAASAWFRFSLLDEVPIAMTSDHVEKLLDVNDILNNGKRPIFEPTNGGREPLEFYFAALTAQLAGTGLTHFTLKLVTSMAGFLTLPFIFLLAREISEDDLTGLLATVAAGIGWWPNVISRNGLRFPFAMLFSAIALWLIVRGLRRDRTNSILLAGVALGIGLYGYTPIRIVPVAIALAFLLYGLHRWSKWVTMKLVAWLAIFAMIVFAAFMPMIRYAVDEPENFWRRTSTRITGEPGLQTARLKWRELSCEEDRSSRPPDVGIDNALLTGWVFVCNEWNSLRMFQWTGDSAWLVSPAGQPALDWVMGGLFFLGLAVTIYRYARYRDWVDLFLLLAIPILLLPSTLALAFPAENPSLHRSGAAIPIVFVIVAIPLRLLAEHGRRALSGWNGSAVGLALASLVLVISAQENWTILFVRYANQYKSSVPNAPEVGAVVRGWVDSIGDWDTVMIKAYPYWVDTRAVGIYAGKFGWNNVALQPDRLGGMKDDPRPKLYILNRDDDEAVAYLRQLYPEGMLAYHASEYRDKNYLTFFVPGTEDFDERLLVEP